MVETIINKPASFASEAEEADWYAANRGYILQQMELAKREGRLQHGTMAKRILLEANGERLLMLSEEDSEKARTQAARKGVRCDLYLQKLLHEALDEAEHAA